MVTARGSQIFRNSGRSVPDFRLAEAVRSVPSVFENPEIRKFRISGFPDFQKFSVPFRPDFAIALMWP